MRKISLVWFLVQSSQQRWFRLYYGCHHQARPGALMYPEARSMVKVFKEHTRSEPPMYFLDELYIHTVYIYIFIFSFVHCKMLKGHPNHRS